MLVLAILMAAGCAAAYPVFAGNGAINCTVYGVYKDSYYQGEPFNERLGVCVIYIDLGLLRFNGTSVERIDPGFTLVDGNDRVYKSRTSRMIPLLQGRRLVGFEVPTEAVAKELVIEPSAKRDGEIFRIELDKPANASNEMVVLTYYGILNSMTIKNRKSITLDVGLTNNWSVPLTISKENFTLLDQWGWIYNSTEGSAKRELKVNETSRTWVTFSSLSPLSRPKELIYDYAGKMQLSIPLEEPERNLSIMSAVEQPIEPEETCNVCGKDAAPVDQGSMKGKVAAARERLSKVKKQDEQG
jgi:hypothetical protein